MFNPRNAWDRPLFKPRYPKLTIKSYTRENDITFSFGKFIDHDDVVGLLVKSGCVTPKSLLDDVNMVKITKNLHNGQVFVTCSKPGVCDDWVDKLNSCEGVEIKKCHSYTDKEIPVKFNFIHPSIDIKAEIVDNFLQKFYGPVKEWFPIKDKKYGIPNGAYIFVMQEEDLSKNPLPESIFLNHIQVFISYRTQVVRCHGCNEVGHIREDCPNQNLFPHLSSANGNGGSVFLDGRMPRRPSFSQKNKEDRNLSSIGNKNNGNVGQNTSLDNVEENDKSGEKEASESIVTKVPSVTKTVEVPSGTVENVVPVVHKADLVQTQEMVIGDEEVGGTKRPHQSFSSGSSDDGKRVKKDEDDEGVRDRKKDDEGVQDGKKKDDDELLMEDNDSDTYVGEEDGLADKESDEYRLSKWLKDNEQLDTDAINLINVEDLSLLNSGGRPPGT